MDIDKFLDGLMSDLGSDRAALDFLKKFDFIKDYRIDVRNRKAVIKVYPDTGERIRIFQDAIKKEEAAK
jgi:hypothetical protein